MTPEERLEALAQLLNQTRDELTELRHDHEQLRSDHAAQAREVDRLSERLRELQEVVDNGPDEDLDQVLQEVADHERRILDEVGS